MNNNYVDSKISQYFFNLIKFGYLCGLPNTTWEDRDLAPKWFTKLHGVISKMINVVMVFLVVLELGALFVQTELSQKQATDLSIFSISHPLLFMFAMSIYYQKKQFKEVIHDLAVKLKKVHNDKEIEVKMLKKIKFYSRALTFLVFSALVLYAFDGAMMVFRNDATFITIVTCWPDVNDKSWLASFARVAIFIVWWLFMMRVTVAYVYVLSITVCLSYQYKNLISYFRGLNKIFEDRNLSHSEMEIKYLNSFKCGLLVHSETLSCTSKTEKACSLINGGKIIINVFVLALLMVQMVQLERTFSNTMSIATTGIGLLITTGFFMCAAGDVTVEAAEIPIAMYESGWHNLKGAVRVRSLLVVAMTLGQKPVVLRTFGILDLSYQSYVSIVKSTYSLFSVLY